MIFPRILDGMVAVSTSTTEGPVLAVLGLSRHRFSGPLTDLSGSKSGRSKLTGRYRPKSCR
jgi:hypothetical protein